MNAIAVNCAEAKEWAVSEKMTYQALAERDRSLPCRLMTSHNVESKLKAQFKRNTRVLPRHGIILTTRN